MGPWRSGGVDVDEKVQDTAAPTRPDRGQATVEVALLLPVLAILLLGLIQIGLLVRAKVLTVHSAREAARAAAVGDDASAGAAAGGLPAGSYVVSATIVGDQVRAVVTYVDPTNVPLVGALVPDITLTSSVTMRKEEWPS